MQAIAAIIGLGLFIALIYGAMIVASVFDAMGAGL